MSAMKALLVVTSNKSKAAEIEAITGYRVEAVKLDIPEIQSLDVEEVAREKALTAFRKVKKPVVVDDTGMAISAIGGLPGALVSWFLSTIGPAGILRLVGSTDDRTASVFTCIGYADANGAHTFLGIRHGSLALEPRGANGFGYDSIFVPEGQKRTYAEMSDQEKNADSMRSDALLKLKSFLATLS